MLVDLTEEMRVHLIQVNHYITDRNPLEAKFWLMEARKALDLIHQDLVELRDGAASSPSNPPASS